MVANRDNRNANRRPRATIGKKMAEARKPFPGRSQQRAAPRVVVQQTAAVEAGGHTIMLHQETKSKTTRSWSDHGTLSEVRARARLRAARAGPRLPPASPRVPPARAAQALDAFTAQYERQLRQLNPQAKQLSYTVQDLHTYIDAMADLSAMVYVAHAKLYAPRGKEFIKAQLLQRLAQAANRPRQ